MGLYPNGKLDAKMELGYNGTQKYPIGYRDRYIPFDLGRLCSTDSNCRVCIQNLECSEIINVARLVHETMVALDTTSEYGQGIPPGYQNL